MASVTRRNINKRGGGVDPPRQLKQFGVFEMSSLFYKNKNYKCKYYIKYKYV